MGKQSAVADLLDGVFTRGGTPYQDMRTVKGDFHRLVAAILDRSSRSDLVAAYQSVGYRGALNVRPFKQAARLFLQRNRRHRRA